MKEQPVDQRKRTGRQGEELAALYLAERGYTIIRRNWRCSLGELDIIASVHETLVFVEVRSRRSQRFGPAEESITPAKQTRLIELAQTYLQQEAAGLDCSWRIDVITVQWEAGSPKLNHVANAVGW